MAVDISSDDSCSATDDDECRSSKRPRPNGAIDQPSRELTFEGISVLCFVIFRRCRVV